MNEFVSGAEWRDFHDLVMRASEQQLDYMKTIVETTITWRKRSLNNKVNLVNVGEKK